MATYTPNHNLYKPDATDAYGDFRTEFNNNMDIIDQMGGGHTIINSGGSDMPARTGLQFIGATVTDDLGNDKTIVTVTGGGGNVYGAFIDTSRIITSGTWNQSLTYTASEDCCVVVEWVSPQNDSAYLNVDGKRIFTNYASSSVDAGNFPVFLKAGQTLTGSTAWNANSAYTVYGLTQGTNGIMHYYSTNEQVIGTWIDGKPLYEKTYYFNDINEATSYSHITGLSIDHCVSCGGSVKLGSGGGSQWTTVPMIENGSYRCDIHWQSSNDSIDIRSSWGATEAYVTIQYTKVTD